MKKIVIEVEGMSCGGCVKKIKSALENDKTISSIDVSLESKLVEISGDDNLSSMSIRNIIIELGFKVNSLKKI